MDKYIGRLLDNRYEILEVIGTGGMAVVYKARCHRLNRLVAIKILKDDFMQDEDFRRRFHSESQAVAMLSHPNIVSVYDVSTSIMADYIVMELIEGISLKQYMEKKGCLNWKETLHFAIQIGKALEHAHSRGIVHRDIKPHNIMVLKNGSVKVTDFGIARMMSKGNTLTKEALGSVHYISPEQAKGGRVDNRSDIYSLGVVMYEMMSGRPPYDGESPVAVAIQHINGGAALPSTLNPNIPGGLEQIIMKAMANDQAKRYVSATEMLRDMDEFRKDPAILFDYNSPKEDVIKIHKPTMVIDTEAVKTTAEHKAEKAAGKPFSEPAVSVRNSSPVRPVTPGTAARRSQDRKEAERRRKQAAARKRNLITIFAVILCVVALGVAAFVLISYVGCSACSTTPVEKVVVPDLAGKYYDELLDDPNYSNFVFKDQKYEHNDKYHAGQVIDQRPKPGEQVTPGSKIMLTISSGPAVQTTEPPETTLPSESTESTIPSDQYVMDDFVGSTEIKARVDLMDTGLQLEIHKETVFSDVVAPTNVVRTEPAAGTPLNKHDKVILYVSYGPQPTMPDFKGSTYADAETNLLGLNLNLDVRRENGYSEDVEKDKIMDSRPGKGNLLDFNQVVYLVISQGPEVVSKNVPPIVGLNVGSAVELLKSAEFHSYDIEMVDSDKDKDVVVSFYVYGDSDADVTGPIDITSKIILRVSNGRAPAVSTKVTSTIKAPTKEDLEVWTSESGIEKNYMDAEGNVAFTMTIVKDSETLHTLEVTAFEQEFTLEFDDPGTDSAEYELMINGNRFKLVTLEFAG